MSASRPLIITLWVVMAISAGGCKWFRRTPAPKPPPVPAGTTPAAPAVEQAPPAPAVPPPKPKTEPAPAPTTQSGPSPIFGQILTPQQQAEFRSAYQQSAQLARQSLGQTFGRTLSSDQAETVNRIRSFLSQADESLTKDLPAAAQLARRAELLARSLLDSLR